MSGKFEPMPNMPKVGSSEWKARREAEVKARRELKEGKVPEKNESVDVDLTGIEDDTEGIPEPIEDLRAKKVADHEKTAANIAELRSKLGAIKDAKELKHVVEEASAGIQIDNDRKDVAQALKEMRAEENAGHRETEQAVKEIVRDEHLKAGLAEIKGKIGRHIQKFAQEAIKNEPADLEAAINQTVEGILNDPELKLIGLGEKRADLARMVRAAYDNTHQKPLSPEESFEANDEPTKPKIQEMIAQDEPPEFSSARHQKLEVQRDELIDKINNNVKKGLWNALKLISLRRELNKTNEALELTLERYNTLSRELVQSQKELEALTEGGEVKLTNPVKIEHKKLLEAEIKKIKKDLAPFEKFIHNAHNQR
jgi:hypothetical protein